MRSLLKLYLGALLLALALAQGGAASASGWIFQGPPNLITPQSGHRSNVFFTGDPITFTLPASASVRYEVRDYYGTLADQGVAVGSITSTVSKPGWYKLYLYGATSTAPWGNSVGGTTFVIFRRDAHFPALPLLSVPGTAPTLAGDEVMRGVLAFGPPRQAVPDAANPLAGIQSLLPAIALDKQYYLGYNDLARPRDLLIAFPNGTSNTAGVAQVATQFQDSVHYYEPRNEPNGGSNGTDFANKEMKPFYQAVKGVNKNLKVLGPGTVSVGPGMLPWIEDFLKAGGGDAIDGFSFHAYNNVNGDLWLARTSLDSLNTLLAKYGQDKKEKWQTEQGYFAATYGAYEPRHQGRWEMLQTMVFEQYGITKEHNVYFYDTSHGFWDFPTFWENRDGGLNPAASLMRVWSEEVYGTKFAQAYDFGDPGNKMYIGSLFHGPAKDVAAFMSAGGTDGKMTLNVSSGDTLRTISAFGVETDLPVQNGQVVLSVPELPVYVEMASGQAINVVPVSWGPNLARLPGVTAKSSGEPNQTNDSDGISKLYNGQMENWYWNFQAGSGPWMSNVASFPAWVELDLPVPSLINRVAIYCPVPWQSQSSLLDYELQYDKNGTWVTIDHVTEDPKTFPVYSQAVACTVDSFYSDRCIFTHEFAPVTTGKIRVLVHDCTWGGGATQDVVTAGGQTGPHQFTIREIEVYSPLFNAAKTDLIQGQIVSPKGVGVAGVTVNLSGSATKTTTTDLRGFYAFSNLTEGGAYTVTPSKTNYSFTNRSVSYSHLVGSQNCGFTANVVPTASGTGLRGDYYSIGYDFYNAFDPSYYQMSRTDTMINFVPSVFQQPITTMLGHQKFAVRWTGQVEPKFSETYNFTVDADQAARLWINNQLVIDGWVRGSGILDVGAINLAAGQRVDIRLEYAAGVGNNHVMLYWSSPSQGKQIVPQNRLYPAVVDVPPTVSLAASPSVVTTGSTAASSTGTLTLSASTVDTGTTVASVSFYANGALIGTRTTAPFTLNWKPIRPGTYQITAISVDSYGGATVSDPVTVSTAPQAAISSPLLH